MTKRDELIEITARAIAPGVWSLFDLWQGDESKLTEWHRAELAMSKSNGAKALDAILAALEKEPTADPGIPVYRLRDGTEDVLGEG